MLWVLCLPVTMLTTGSSPKRHSQQYRRVHTQAPSHIARIKQSVISAAWFVLQDPAAFAVMADSASYTIISTSQCRRE